jgi:protein disulfide-isomerase A1
MDSTENEVSSVSIKGFPTLKLFKRGSKSTPIDYSGAREV